MPLYHPHKGRLHPGKQRDFVCDVEGCEDAPDCPMLHEDVWAEVSHPRGLLCIKHTEEKLGRPIMIDDLSDCVGNAFAFRLYDHFTEAKLGDPI